jgi:hypothetical protein
VLNTGVFAITSVLSLWAYIWLYMCLLVISPDEVGIAEAWITFLSFFALVAVAYAADKWFYTRLDSIKSDEQKLLDEKDLTIQIKKTAMRTFVMNYGEMAVCNVAQNLRNDHTAAVPAEDQKEIIENL